MKLIPLFLTIPGALVFFLIGIGAYQRAARFAPWTRYICLALSFMILAFGVLGYLRGFGRATFSETAYSRIVHLSSWIGGMIIGSFFTALVSGEFSKLWKRSSPSQLPPA